MLDTVRACNGKGFCRNGRMSLARKRMGSRHTLRRLSAASFRMYTDCYRISGMDHLRLARRPIRDR